MKLSSETSYFDATVALQWMGICTTSIGPVSQPPPLREDSEAIQAFADFVETHKMSAIVLHAIQGQSNTLCRQLSRRLQAYQLRRQAIEQVYETVLHHTVAALAPVDTILLKGAVLRHLVYPAPALRPVADIDLWVAPDQIDNAVSALLEAGFTQVDAKGKYGPDDHHAPPLVYKGVAVEIHRRFLGGGRASYWHQVRPRAVALGNLLGIEYPHLYRPNTTDMIWQAYHHTFRSHLGWVPWSMLGVSDILRLMELPDVDWDMIRTLKGLAQLRALAPLPRNADRAIPHFKLAPGFSYIPFPWHRWRQSDWWLHPPSPWWLKMRHGIEGKFLLQCWLMHMQDLKRRTRARDAELPEIFQDF